VELTETLSSAPYRVGEPITRTLQLRALGVSESILPELPATAPRDSQIYPDQPVRALGQDGGRLVATLEQKLAIVPGGPGALELPAIRLPWWDVESDRLAWAQLPAKTVEVLPAAQIAGATGHTIADAGLDASPLQSQTPIPTGTSLGIAPGSLWPWISLLFATLWLGTLGLWWLSPRQLKPTRAAVQPGERAARLDLEAACRRADPAAAEQAAVRLYRARGGARVSSARALANLIEQPALRAALIDLDQARFAAQGQRWNGQALIKEIDAMRPQAADLAQPQPTPELPPLYPRS
jgi:hypothetical protein